MTINKSLVGALIGAAVALTWLVFDTGAVVLLVFLAGLGALIGSTLDNPQRVIDALERLQSR